MAKTKSNSKRKTRSDKFPLTLHPTGQYCKKIKGKLYEWRLLKGFNKKALLLPIKDMLEAVIENNVAPTRISFVAAVRIIITYAPAMAMRPLHQLSQLYHAILKEIAGWLVPKRPGRLEPRRPAHDPKHYPRLRITRPQWSKQYVA